MILSYDFKDNSTRAADPPTMETLYPSEDSETTSRSTLTQPQKKKKKKMDEFSLTGGWWSEPGGRHCPHANANANAISWAKHSVNGYASGDTDGDAGSCSEGESEGETGRKQVKTKTSSIRSKM